MAKKTSIINVVVTGDTKNFKKALGRASDSIGNFSKRIGQVGIATGIALAGIGAKAVGLAVDFEESLSKSQAIFEGAAKGIEDSAKGAATALGLSQSEFLEAAANMGVFGKAAGLSGSDLSGFATEMVTVAADVASFNNLRPEEALEKLQAGLRGSNEPLQSIGILINAAAVNAKALEMGLGDANGEISEGNKIMARQALIMEKLGEQGALGDFAKTSGGLANQTRILKARFKNLGIELGKKLIPIATKISKIIGKLIGFGEKLAKIYGKKGFKGVVQELVKGFVSLRKRLLNTLRDLLPKIGRKLLEIAPVIGKAVKNLAVDSAKRLITLGRAFVDWIGPLIPVILQKLKELGATFIDWIAPLIPPVLEKLWDFIKAIGSFIKEKLPWLAEKIGIIAAAFLDWISPLVKKLLENLPTIVKTIVKWLANEAIPLIVKTAGKLAEKLVPALLDFGVAVLEGVKSILIEVGNEMKKGAGKLAELFYDKAIKPIVDNAKELAGKISNALINFASDASSGAKHLGRKIVDALISGLKSVGGFFADLGTTLADSFMSAFKSVWNTVVAGPINAGIAFAVDLLDKALGPWVNFDEPGEVIPRLAAGGIVNSPTLAMIGEAGPEAVIPLSKMGGMGGNNITINMPTGSNGDDVVRALQRYQAINGAVPINTRAF